MHVCRLICLTGFAVLSSARPQSDDPSSDNTLSERLLPISNTDYEAPDDAQQIDYRNLGDPQRCGYSSKEVSRVAPGGGQARLRDYPWMAAILRKQDKFHFCGGVIVTQRHILTASHCLMHLDKNKLFVRVGEYDFTRENDTETYDFAIQEIRNHDDYDHPTHQHDISILVLDRRIGFSRNILPVCLPLPGEDFTNRTAVVAGWGSEFFGGPMSEVLREVAVPVWEQAKCRAAFTLTIFDTNHCAAAYEGGKDSCQGDSGGPLLTQRDDGRWITIGVVSWGIGCAERGKPGIYTSVSKYLDWIAPRIQDV